MNYFSDSVFVVKKDEKLGLITLDGKTILEPKFILPDKWRNIKAPYIIFINNEKLTKIVIDDKTGFIDENGKMAIKAKYDSVSNFKEGIAAIKLNGKWGYIDKKGQMLVKPKFDFVSGFLNGFSEVRLNDKWGLINIKREFVIKPEFDKIDQVENAILIEKIENTALQVLMAKF
ncbi:WG repeat-containing protein [Campylobacter jejuni]|nr:WG repeat-containing protein [Campylobacter jejuni]